jgi:L-aspartate semialdehyde sulfurtransferase ferredoxin
MRKVIQVNYPADLVSQPVVAHLISEFRLEVNILRAEVEREEGWIILEMSGEPQQIEDACAWLRGQGLELRENPPLDDKNLGNRREFFS